MTNRELDWMLNDARQKYLHRVFNTLISEYKLEPCEVLQISESNIYYADKLLSGKCRITPILAKRILERYHRIVPDESVPPEALIDTSAISDASL